METIKLFWGRGGRRERHTQRESNLQTHWFSLCKPFFFPFLTECLNVSPSFQAAVFFFYKCFYKKKSTFLAYIRYKYCTLDTEVRSNLCQHQLQHVDIEVSSFRYIRIITNRTCSQTKKFFLRAVDISWGKVEVQYS